MSDKKELLGRLSIDDSQREAGRRFPKIVITVAGTILLALLAWFWLSPDSDPIHVNTTTAESAAESVSTRGNAVLDASGYVTARRQATVSSKFTGKVVEVYIEEGVVVEKNQLLAKLDDSTQLAQYNLTRTQLEAAESRCRKQVSN